MALQQCGDTASKHRDTCWRKSPAPIPPADGTQQLPTLALNAFNVGHRLHLADILHCHLGDPLHARSVAPQPGNGSWLQRTSLHGAQTALRLVALLLQDQRQGIHHSSPRSALLRQWFLTDQVCGINCMKHGLLKQRCSVLPIALQSFAQPKFRQSSWSAATKAQPPWPCCKCSNAAWQNGQQVACPADLHYPAGQICLCCIQQQIGGSCLTPGSPP